MESKYIAETDLLDIVCLKVSMLIVMTIFFNDADDLIGVNVCDDNESGRLAPGDERHSDDANVCDDNDSGRLAPGDESFVNDADDVNVDDDFD